MRILIPWPRWQMFGGLSRFVNIKRCLEKSKHQVTLCATKGLISNPWDLPMIDYETAAGAKWDAVFIPGAGLSINNLSVFKRFRQRQFGLRVLFVLSNATVLDRYLRMKRTVNPHAVIWNNWHWSKRDMEEFAGNAKPYVLQGAVDLRIFREYALLPQRSTWINEWAKKDSLVVGGYAAKSSELFYYLVTQEYPFPITFKLFGTRYGQAEIKGKEERALKRAGVELCGKLTGCDLATFYNECHVILCDDKRAGWNNVAAEAMACGCVVISRPQGVRAFIRSDENGILVKAREPMERFRELLFALNQQRADGERLSQAAAMTMRAWSWEVYCRQLVEILKDGFKGNR